MLSRATQSNLVLGCLAWAFFSTSPVAAQVTVLGGRFAVNDSVAGDHSFPVVAVGGDGGFIVVWRTVEGGAEGLSGRLLDAAGEPIGGDLVVEPLREGPVGPPAIAAHDDGRFVVAWRTVSGRVGIETRRVDADGGLLADLAPIEDRVIYAVEPDLAPLGGGTSVLVWREGGAGFTQDQIKARLYPPAGNAGPEFVVNDSDYWFYIGNQERPSVAGGGGEFVVVWEDQGFSSPGIGRLIGYRRFWENGEPLGSESSVFPDLDRLGELETTEPRVAVDAAGNFVVTWVQRSDPLSYFHVWARRFSRSGGPGEPFRVNAATAGDQRAPDVVMDRQGNFIVVWRSDESGEARIEGRSFNRFGEPREAGFEVSIGAALDARPTHALSAANQLLVVWHEPRVDGDGSDVVGQRYFAGFDTDCVEDARTLCLRDRFEVTLDWRDFAGRSGPASVAQARSEDSGLFWFFRPHNWEVLVKVVDGCAFNGFFWVFAAATTNVEYDLTVTDVLTLDRRTYRNTLGVASPAITDITAFPTCWAGR